MYLTTHSGLVATAARGATGEKRPLPYTLPRACTPSQAHTIAKNPGGLLGRFGLSGLPTNSWLCHGKEFTLTEQEWRARGIDDRNRSTEACLGSIHTFSTTYAYGKGSAQKHSDFKSAVCQRVYTTFKLADPGMWWLDISCGGALPYFCTIARFATPSTNSMLVFRRCNSAARCGYV